MNRQYIGARYVPVFFDGPNGSAWMPGVSYEPLTIVTLYGNSYTSKKLVPTNVGAPNENPEYWVATGSFNAQIDEYRQEVADLKSEVDQQFDALGEEINSKYNQDNVIPYSAAKWVYVDAVNGSDNNDGSNDHPFLTLDKAIDMLNKDTSNIYIYFKSAGVYTTTKVIFNCVTIHFEPLVDGVVINFNNRSPIFYNSHINFNSTNEYQLTVYHGFNGTSPANAIAFENCSTFAQKTTFKSNVYTIGGFLWFSNTIFDDPVISSTLGRARFIARGTVCLMNGITIKSALSITDGFLSFNMCPRVVIYGNNYINLSLDQAGGYVALFATSLVVLQTFFVNSNAGKAHHAIYSNLGMLNYAAAAQQIEELECISSDKILPVTNVADVRIASYS